MAEKKGVGHAYNIDFLNVDVVRVPDTLLLDRKSTRLNSSHQIISYAVFCLKKKKYKLSVGWFEDSSYASNASTFRRRSGSSVGIEYRGAGVYTASLDRNSAHNLSHLSHNTQ